MAIYPNQSFDSDLDVDSRSPDLDSRNPDLDSSYIGSNQVEKQNGGKKQTV